MTIKFSNKKVDAKDVLFLSVLFLYAVDFKGYANYLVLFFIAIAFAVCGCGSKKVTLSNFFLMLFGGLYTLFTALNLKLETQVIIRYLIAPGMVYAIMYKYVDDDSKRISTLLIAVGGLFLHGTLNMLLSLSKGYSVGYISNVWGGMMTQTLQGMLMLPVAALFQPSIVAFKKSKLYMFGVAASVLSLFFTVISGRRTLLFVFFIVIAANWLVDLAESRNVEGFLKKIMAIICAIAVAIGLYQCNIGGVKTTFENSTLYYRLFIAKETELGAGRFETHMRVLRNSISFILGSSGLDSSYGNGYAHNLWIDTMVIGGWLSAIFLLVYTFFTVRVLVMLIRKCGIENYFVRLYFSVDIALMLGFMVEPVLQGAPHVFIIWCALNAIAERKLCQVIGGCGNENCTN